MDTQPLLEMGSPTRAGYVALVGKPNVGKSSLLNRFTDQKLSIVTALPQTTRDRVVGIDTRDGVQMVLLDTPGLVEPQYLLHESMLHAARGTLTEADVILLLLDGTDTAPTLDEQALIALHAQRAKLLPVVNKVDIAAEESVKQLTAWAADRFQAQALPVSAVPVPAGRDLFAARALFRRGTDSRNRLGVVPSRNSIQRGGEGGRISRVSNPCSYSREHFCGAGIAEGDPDRAAWVRDP
jgi:small GTP-binding protein